MMTPRTNPDLIPGAPWWVNALVKLGAFGIIAALCGMMVWQNRETSVALVSSNLRSVEVLPTIAAEMRDDNRANATFMREHTANAILARREMDVKLAAIDTRLATVMQELVSIRSEQQKTYQLFLDALQRVGSEGNPKNAPAAPNNGGA